MNLCCFCGSEGVTVEHVIPDWVNSLYPQNGRFHVEASQTDEKTWEYDAKGFDLKAKCVCKNCNNTWMSDLENQARPLLARMITGDEITIDKKAQLTLARWVMKTTFILEYTGSSKRKKFYTEHERNWFYSTKQPLSNTLIWLSMYIGNKACLTDDCFFEIIRDNRPLAPAYSSSFVIGYSCFQVMTHRLTPEINGSPRLELDLKKDKNYAEAHFQIWPYVQPCIWPPKAIFDDQEIQGYFYRWV